MEHTRFYTVKYHVTSLWDFLRPPETFGLDKTATIRRFERLLNQKLCCAYPPYDAVKFEYFNRKLPLKIVGRKGYVVDQSDYAVFRDLKINLPWLTYYTVEDHVQALRNVLREPLTNHVVVLPSILVTNYIHEKDETNSHIVTSQYIIDLCNQAKDEKVWLSTRFVLDSC